MRMRDINPLRRLERLRRREQIVNHGVRDIDTDQPTPHDDLLREIVALPEDWHGAGVCGASPLRAMAIHAPSRLLHSAETGCGKSTLLLSHISQHHTVFTMDDSGQSNSLTKVRESPFLRGEVVEFVTGPTQQTLPRHTFENRLQLVFIDGPHGYPFPELEYHFFYPQLDEGALLILDDIHIPTIYRLFSFLREDAMFDFLGVSYMTAFFLRNASPLFDPTGDGWWLQRYNQKRFPASDLDQDFIRPGAPCSPEFEQLMRRFGHWPLPVR